MVGLGATCGGLRDLSLEQKEFLEPIDKSLALFLGMKSRRATQPQISLLKVTENKIWFEIKLRRMENIILKSCTYIWRKYRSRHKLIESHKQARTFSAKNVSFLILMTPLSSPAETKECGNLKLRHIHEYQGLCRTMCFFFPPLNLLNLSWFPPPPP